VRNPPYDPKGIVSNSVPLPGSVPQVLDASRESPDLVTMKGNLPTKVAKEENSALAFSKVTSEDTLPATPQAKNIGAVTPKNPPGMEPICYPRAPIKRHRRKRNGY